MEQDYPGGKSESVWGQYALAGPEEPHDTAPALEAVVAPLRFSWYWSSKLGSTILIPVRRINWQRNLNANKKKGNV